MIAVIVPWRPDNAERDRNWAWLRKQWEPTGWDIVEGHCPDGPWVKSHAVADALKRTTADTLVIADADVWCTTVHSAVETVVNDAAWAIPHHHVHRLTPEATGHLTAGTTTWNVHAPTTQKPYPGVPGGGLTVIRRDLYEQAPFDPRFQGWGQEDEAAGHAWTVLAGPPKRGNASLWHLWHPPQQRMGRVIGNPQGKTLRDRYRTTLTPHGIRALAAEHQ